MFLYIIFIIIIIIIIIKFLVSSHLTRIWICHLVFKFKIKREFFLPICCNYSPGTLIWNGKIWKRKQMIWEWEGKCEDFVYKVIGMYLIPKFSKDESFNAYRPISLCNLVYKNVAKVISNRIKSILARMISKEQFGFFSNRKIMDAIVMA